MSDAEDASETRARAWFTAGSIAAVWALYILLVALRISLIDFPHKTALVERHVLVALIGAALTVALDFTLGRLPLKGFKPRLAAGVILAALPAVILALANYDVMFVFDPAELWSRNYRASVNLIEIAAQTITENYFIFAAWIMLMEAVAAVAREGEASRRAALASVQVKDAQLRALRYQLDPHFLFNALNTVSALVVREDVEAAERAVSALSDFLRATLETEVGQEAALAREIELQRLYLAVELIRFANRLDVSIEVEDEALPALVPSLILQPLIENVIRHAVNQTGRRVRLGVRALVQGDRLRITVQDDGPGRSEAVGVGVGLRNVESRLALVYGPGARLRHGPGARGGYDVELALPYRTAAS
jgi:two-component system, LytTR family, sensor kinase